MGNRYKNHPHGRQRALLLQIDRYGWLLVAGAKRKFALSNESAGSLETRGARFRVSLALGGT